MDNFAQAIYILIDLLQEKKILVAITSGDRLENKIDFPSSFTRVLVIYHSFLGHLN